MTEGRDDTISGRRLFELLAAVADLAPTQREQVLEGHDPEVAAKVRAMLAAHDSSDGFLEPTGSRVRSEERMEDPVLAQGKSIGPYVVTQLLGEGGMGRVYAARQDEPVRRRVALKVLRFASSGPRATARFISERHAMGRLDHPNIGKILDAGTTERGEPFFAMELIDGSPITGYCDRRSLGLDDRLRLFAAVCRGVDHAHNKLLLHRDIKPSNVLVTEIDGRPIPKLIDFGIAKPLDEGVDRATHGTGDRLIGTPAYMSPEALGLGGDVDTRSDVFSLGVLLYELLVGSHPWSEKTDIPAAGAPAAGVPAADTPAAVLKSRLETDPLRPSSRITHYRADQAELVAERRRTASENLAGRLRGDLDWIVMRAIAESPDQRFGSAAELADDIERYLRNEPVTARPPTAAYLARKLIQRHRAPVIATAVALTAIVLGLVGASIGFTRARTAEALARDEAMAALQARDEANEVVSFLIRIFRGAGLDRVGSATPPAERTARELLDAGAVLIEDELTTRPFTKARMERTLGQVYRELAAWEPAMDHLQAALALLESSGSPPAHDLTGTLLDLATVSVHTGDRDQAVEYLARSLDVSFDPEDSVHLELRANIFATLGRTERQRGNFDRALAHGREAIDIARSLPEPNPLTLPNMINNLGSTYFAQGRWQEAETSFREAMAIYETHLEPGNRRRIQAADNVGAAIASQGRLDEAAPLFEKALAERRRLLPPSHPSLADSLNNVGTIHLDRGQPKLAEPFHREALSIRLEALGPDHPRTAWSHDNLARSLGDAGRLAEAREQQRQALAIREAALGPDHLDVARSLDHLGALTATEERWQDAAGFYRRSLRIRTEALEPGHVMIATTALPLGEVELRLGADESGRAHLELAVSILEGVPSEAENLAEARRLLGISERR